MKDRIWLILCFVLFSCEKERLYQFKLNDGFNIFCKKYEKHEMKDDTFYSISDCCVMDDRQKMLVKNGIKKSELRYIARYPQDW